MEKFIRSFSLRKKNDAALEASKPYLWQEDERHVRNGTCSFQVKYLGCTEVFESRGIQVCEEAIHQLKNAKSKCHRAVLYVSGDALRVVDEISKGLLVDQTIEKVSFCAPDRGNDKGFAYICRDGTTRRWLCHCFMALKDSGERLSHAVGCAFTICLEKKQQRDKEKLSLTLSHNPSVAINGDTAQRTGSFRQTSLAERLTDPQSAIIAEPVPVCKCDTPYAVRRPHASLDLISNQPSLTSFDKLSEKSSPFKRQQLSPVVRRENTSDRESPASACQPVPHQTVDIRVARAISSDYATVSASKLCPEYVTTSQPKTAPPSFDYWTAPNYNNQLSTEAVQLKPSHNATLAPLLEISTPPKMQVVTCTERGTALLTGVVVPQPHGDGISAAERWLRSAATSVCVGWVGCPTANGTTSQHDYDAFDTVAWHTTNRPSMNNPFHHHHANGGVDVSAKSFEMKL